MTAFIIYDTALGVIGSNLPEDYIELARFEEYKRQCNLIKHYGDLILDYIFKNLGINKDSIDKINRIFKNYRGIEIIKVANYSVLDKKFKIYKFC